MLIGGLLAVLNSRFPLPLFDRFGGKMFGKMYGLKPFAEGLIWAFAAPTTHLFADTL